jgi:predicted flap endonuclease-1-like 5' DNA nuclease/predicted regulator of Ras-like GTPase activity (Roadblock/LC7/MglB family)
VKFMAGKKGKPQTAALEEKDTPEIALEFSEDEINEDSDALEKAEALTRRIRAMIEGPGDSSTPTNEREEADLSKDIALSEIDGIGPAYQKTLKEHGIMSVQMLLAADAKSLAKKTKFSAAKIREWQDKGKSLVGDADVDEENQDEPDEAEAAKEQEAAELNTEDKLHGETEMKRNVEKIKGREGVIGYILRDATSASIDLKDPTKIVEYAVLSSSSLEAGDELSYVFKLGETKQVLVEGHEVKLVSLTVGDSKVSVFMEKTVDHKRVYKDLLG